VFLGVGIEGFAGDAARTSMPKSNIKGLDTHGKQKTGRERRRVDGEVNVEVEGKD